MSELKIIRMSDIQSEPVNWLWQPYIPKGAISLIQGDGNQGKTTISLAIAAAVTKGEPLPGQGGVGYIAHSNVIVINAEDSYAQTIKPRLEQLGADCDRVFTIDEDDIPLTYVDKRLEQIIERTQAALIILDPLQAFWGRSNMNAAGSVRPILKQLGAVAARHDCAVLLVGHLHKKGGKAAYRGLGSIDIFAAARSVMTVGSVDDLRAFIHNKSNLSPSGNSLSFEIDPVSGFHWCGECDITADELFKGKKDEPKPESQFDKACRLIRQALAKGLVTAIIMEELARKNGISSKTFNRAKVKVGAVSTKHNGQWWWQIPVDVEVVYDDVGEGSQHSQEGQTKTLSVLTTLPHLEGEVG